MFASIAVVAAWFPTSTLFHQRAQLASASTALSRLDQQNTALRHEETELRTRATIGRTAQQQYDVVPPGDVAYQVLPASGSTGSDGALAGTATAARQGLSGSSQTGHTSGSGSRDTGSSGSSGSFFGRVLQTLEFWR